MRWHYFEPEDAAESLERDRLLRAIHDWWDAFIADADDIDNCFSRGIGFDVVGFMRQHLSPVSPQLCWEYGRAIHKAGHRLIFTSESNKHLRPLIAQLLSQSPSLPRWEFYEFRFPENLGISIASVKKRGVMDPTNFKFRASVGRYARIDIEFVNDAGEKIDAESVRTSGFLLTERLLGEELLDKWIGGIEGRIAAPEEAHVSPGRFIPLNRLRDTVLATIQAIREQLPDEPIHRINAVDTDAAKPMWTVLEMPEPEILDDYPRWSDLLVATTRRVDLCQATHECQAFYSERFTRCGETFCYLKIEGIDGLDTEKFADRGEIEDAVNATLVNADCGCVLGGGTGRRYSYIDLVVTDVREAIIQLRNVLRTGNIPKRTWLLFFEQGLEHEWLGIWNDTPAPPADVHGNMYD